MLAGKGRAETVGHRRGLDGHRLARLETAVERVGELRLDGDDTTALGRDGDSRDEPAASHGDDDDLRIGHVLEDLQPDGALPGDRERIVEGMDEGPAGLLHQLAETLERLGRPTRFEVNVGSRTFFFPM